MPERDYCLKKYLHNVYMNLLDYTKKLSEKIKFYDSIAQNPFLNMTNPFAKPINVTIVWVESDYDDS